MSIKKQESVYSEDVRKSSEFIFKHDEFIQAASDKNWVLCKSIRNEINSLWPGILDKPFIKFCPDSFGSPGTVPSRRPKGGRHRWMFFDMYGEERCMNCGCQRPKK